MRAAFSGLSLELPPFFRAGSEAFLSMKELGREGASVDIKHLPAAKSAAEVAAAYARFLKKAMPGVSLRESESCTSPWGPAAVGEARFTAEGREIFQVLQFVQPSPRSAWVITCTLPGADPKSGGAIARKVLGQLGKPHDPDTLALAEVTLGLTGAPAAATALFLPAAPAAGFRPSIAIAYEPSSRLALSDHAAGVRRELSHDAQELHVIDAGPVETPAGPGFRHDLTLEKDSAGVFTSQVYVSAGKRRVVVTLTVATGQLVVGSRAMSELVPTFRV